MITRRILLSALPAAGLCALAAGPAATQSYPNRPIKIIVPFPPGGVDVTARLVADRIAAALGQPVVVENRPGGAGGSVGAKAAASAEPDGYTLFFTTPGPLTIGPAINKNLDYDPVKSFSAVAMVASSPIMLVINPQLPVQSVAELVAYAKGNPGKVNYPSPGFGTQPHLLGEMFKSMTGTIIVHIPYKGSAPSITDLIAGEVQMYFDNTPNVLQFVQAGKLRALALASESRHPKLPGLPTMVESGLPGFVATYWNGLLAPAGTPANIVARLNAAVNDGLKSPDLQATLARLGAEPKGGSPREFAAFIADEAQKWAAVAKAADVKVD